jgi:dienelactone hydrolase
MKCIISIVWTLVAVYVNGQKLPIDTSVLDKWPRVSQFGAEISNDGQYVSYFIDNKPLHGQTLVLQKSDSSWKKEYSDARVNSPILFSSDSKKCIFLQHDTLWVQMLGLDKVDFVKDVADYQKSESIGGSWLAYKLRNFNDSLLLTNLSSGKSMGFSDVKEYQFELGGSSFLIKRRMRIKGCFYEEVQLVRLDNLGAQTIWSDTSITDKDISSNYVFDSKGEQLAFEVDREKNGKILKELWHFRSGDPLATLIVSDETIALDSMLTISGSPKFSKSGKWLFFDLLRKIAQQPTSAGKGIGVYVWSYKDIMVNPDARVFKDRGRTFTAAIKSTGGSAIVIEKENEDLKIDPANVTGDYVVTGCVSHLAKYWWNYPLEPYYLISLKDGHRTCLNNLSVAYVGNEFYPSPDGQYIVFYDAKQNGFFRLDPETNRSTNLTFGITMRLNADHTDSRTLKFGRVSVAGVIGWQTSDSSFFVYDNYDIWKVYLFGTHKPINVTNGFGEAHHIKLRIVGGPGNTGDPRRVAFHANERLLLVGFNELNKYNGFYTIQNGQRENPELLSMGPFTYYMEESQKPHGYTFSDGFQPVKAKSGNSWLVQRQSLGDAPNFYLTKDFRSYSRLTNLQPQRSYRWMSDSLITWKLPNGKMCQGILYRPDDFDPRRKYPVIFNFYEKLSHTLYQFPYPAYTAADINIPWFVANGYLVFIPDIVYEEGITAGRAAYNAVTSGANYLSKLQYVDRTKIGLQGHSFGAYETNFIISHSKLFAAAAEFAGISDDVSGYLTLVPFLSSTEHAENQTILEAGHSNFGATPWQKRDRFIDNSAVLRANDIYTPLLITHNPSDNNIPWRQGVELYMALRRLNRKVWMLQYDNSGHNMFGDDAVDYTLRLTQFFDYFLRDKYPPLWMTKSSDEQQTPHCKNFNLDKSGTKP